MELPLACTLDARAFSEQAARYGRVAQAVAELQRAPLAVTALLDPSVEPELVEELVSVERECCPFYAIEWDPGQARLRFSVDSQHALALDAIAAALTPART